MKVMVVGSGTMGCGIVQVLASNDTEVILHGMNKEAAEFGLNQIAKNLQKSVSKGKLSEEARDTVLKNITTTTELESAKDCDLVIEAIIEDLKVKKELFKKLDEICDEKTILASNTSSLSITDLSVSTKRSDKVIGMHFFNPAVVMKLVEIIDGMFTSEETHEIIVNLTNKIGKSAVTVKEAPGFVVNRILVPMINEAIGIYADGVASVEDIDTAMMLGANHPIGPLALGDLIGLDVCLNIMEVLYVEFGDTKYRPHPLLRKMVRSNLLGRKTNKGFYDYK